MRATQRAVSLVPHHFHCVVQRMRALVHSKSRNMFAMSVKSGYHLHPRCVYLARKVVRIVQIPFWIYLVPGFG